MRAVRLLAAVVLIGGACRAAGRPASEADKGRPRDAGPTDMLSAPGSRAASGDGAATPSTPEAPFAQPPSSSRQQGTTTTAGRKLAATSTTTTTAQTTTTAAHRACPSPKTCPTYTLSPGVTHGWRAGSDGVARIPWWFDPTVPPGSSLTSDQIRRAMLAAIAVWEAADPNVRFDYQGDWTGVSYQGDGRSVFGYGLGVTTTTAGGYIVETDIARSPQADNDSWDPCAQRDDSCENGPAPYANDVQEIFTHELGHTLGLGDLSDTPDTHWMTMQHEAQPGERFRCTLALGDVLGLRHLYPTNAPMPVIYDP